ncbi:MAG: NADH-quinone oxidoreductase subunit J [Thermoplasmata archaeon]|nr:NADH-quinone oxidoreductase subunit J [Thermoplasmata archaeon]
MDFQLLSFYVIGAMILVSALQVLRSREIIHSVMWLGLTFIGISGLFILLNAEYLAIVQILIYAGAITILILFAVMLTRREIMNKEGGEEE